MSRARIIQGDCREVLRSLPSESVQCCITSPPYWGLRDYGIPLSVWGGDRDHEHEWSHEVLVHATNHTDKRRWNHARNGRGEEQPLDKRPGWKRQHIGQRHFCACGAWRGAFGLEPTFDLYVKHAVEIFGEIRRVLRNDGTLWLNLGDSYRANGSNQVPQTKRHIGSGFAGPNRNGITGLKPKDLVGIPWRVVFALQEDGWYLRSDIIWHKTNPMPESVQDRPTKSHEYLFLLAKSERYYYDCKAIQEPASPDTHARYARGRSDNHKWADGGPGRQTIATNKPGSLFGNRPGVNPKCAEPGSGIKQNSSFSAAVKDVVSFRNKRTVWTLSTKPFKGAHFATFPPRLIEPCVLAGSPEAGRCPECGAPWIRIVERSGSGPKRKQRKCTQTRLTEFAGQAWVKWKAENPDKYLGWMDSCGHGLPPVPATVLDPFNGAGTTGLVALQHNRDYLGIDLNPEYCAMAEKRLGLKGDAA